MVLSSGLHFPIYTLPLLSGPFTMKHFKQQKPKLSPAEATEKFGLEAGLYNVFASKDGKDSGSKTDQAKQLLAKYGSAYLVTSISLASVSFAICYFAVTAGASAAISIHFITQLQFQSFL